MKEVDWSKFDNLSKPECECRCGAIWHTHAKASYVGGVRTVTQVPCPQCGRNDNIRRITHEPETFTIHG